MSEIITQDDMRKLFGIEFDNSGKITQFGGFAPFIEYLKKCKLRERLQPILGEYGARSFLQLMVGVILGIRDMEELTRVSGDPLIKGFLGNPVTETQIARNYKSFTPASIEDLHQFAISLALLDISTFLDRKKDLVIDVDATSVVKHGKQEGVEYGYTGHGDQTEKCYQYLFFRLNELNTFLYGTIRAGSTHSQNGFNEYLKRFLPMFSHSGRRLHLRADSGYFNEESFDVCQENQAFLYVKAPMSPSRKDQAASAALEWMTDEMDPKVSYASFTCYTKNNAIWREVFKRVETDEPDILFTNYRFDCIGTNDMTRSPKDIYAFYNGRANIENNIKELKNDYHLGSIATSSFTANDAITQTIMVAYILVQHFKRIALDDHSQRFMLSTLRWRIFNIPGRKISSGHRIWFRLVNAFLRPRDYLGMFQRIRATLSILVTPPPVFIFA